MISRKLINWRILNELTGYLRDNNLGGFQHLRDQLLGNEDMQDRKNMNGHVTSSFFLLNPARTHVLMIYHKGLNKWLCPGGHYEDFVTLFESAVRELLEETGYNGMINHMIFPLLGRPLDIDSHIIPARPAKNEGEHFHHDFMYFGVAMNDHVPIPQLEEVYAAEWKLLEEAAQLPDARTRRITNKVLELIR